MLNSKQRLSELFRNAVGRRRQTGNASVTALTGGAAGTAVECTGEIALNILSDVAKVAEKVPYLAGIAGILSSILQIRQEMKNAEKYTQEVVDYAVGLCKNLFSQLRVLLESPVNPNLDNLQNDLKEFVQFLERMEQDLRKSQRSHWSRLTSRKGDIVKEWDRKLLRFHNSFQANRIIEIEKLLATNIESVSSQACPLPGWASIPAPGLMFGREEELDILLSHVQDHKPICLAILGAGGMGKTTLALHFMQTERVCNHYPLQVFVSCEGHSLLDQLLQDIAEDIQIQIPAEKQKIHLQVTVLEELKRQSGQVLLCIDNMETLWELDETQEEIEQFLNSLSKLPNLGLLITMRGCQRPSGVIWPAPFLKPLSNLDPKASLQTYEKITQSFSITHTVHQLLCEMEGIPLAITLISHLIRDEIESVDSLWNRWKREKTKVLKTGKHKSSSVDISVSLSFKSSRMTDEAKYLLYMLSWLPNGFSVRKEILEEVIHYIPEFNEALHILKTVALVQINESARIHILSPIKEFCLQLKGFKEYLPEIIVFYISLIYQYKNYTSKEAYEIILPEFYNLKHILTECYDMNQASNEVIWNTIYWSEWSIYLGRASDILIKQAIAHCKDPGLQGNCYLVMGRLFMGEYNFDKAEQSFREALIFHQQAQNVLGQGNDLQSLGELYMWREKLEEAEESFRKALVFHKQAQSVLGQGNVLHNLGVLYMHRDQLDEAEKSFREALILHKQRQNLNGQGNDLSDLGILYMRRDQLDEAEESFREALVLHKQTQNVLGQANGLINLGEVYMRRDQPVEAEKSFREALILHKQAQDVLGQGDDLINLGKLYMYRDQLDKAEKLFREALILHKQAQNVIGQGNDLSNLGVLYMDRDQLDEAETSLREAMVFHKQAQDVLGQENNLQNLGKLYMCRDQLDEAEKSFREALILHKQAQNVIGQGNDLCNLGVLYMYRDQLNEAEISIREALVFHKQAQDVLGQGNDLRNLGELYMWREKLEKAEESFREALVFHKQAQSVLGQGNDLHNLGVLYMCRGQLGEAETSFREALIFHKQAQDNIGQSIDLAKLEELRAISKQRLSGSCSSYRDFGFY